jgi:hypothetical protein
MLSANRYRIAKLLRTALCAVLVSAHVFTFAHLALVSHRTCVEHGEAIHAEALSPTLQAGAKAESAVEGQAPDVAGHEHEHCICLAFGRSKLVLSAPAMGRLPEAPTVVEALCDAPDCLVGGAEILAFAPKASPPV